MFNFTCCTALILPCRFIDRMDLAYAAADLAVSRAGAITCSELMLTQTPSILVRTDCKLSYLHFDQFQKYQSAKQHTPFLVHSIMRRGSRMDFPLELVLTRWQWVNQKRIQGPLKGANAWQL